VHRSGACTTAAATLSRPNVFLRTADFAGCSTAHELALASPGLSAAVAGTQKFYVYSTCNGKSMSSGECYDPGTNRWVQLAPMSRERCASANVIIGGHLFVCGGHSTNLQVWNSVERLDLSTGAWKTMAPLTRPRAYAATAVLGGQIYICGGLLNSKATLSSAERFDPARRTWHMLRPMSQARCCAQACTVGGRLYVWGGISAPGNKNGVVDLMERFDPAVGAWEQLQPMLEARVFAATAADARFIYACGGCRERKFGAATFSAERFDVATEKWESLPPMLQERYGAIAAMSGTGRVFVCGGAQAPAYVTLQTVEAFNPATQKWEVQRPMECARVFALYAVIGGHLYMCGGVDGGKVLNSAERLCLRTGKWETLPPMLEPRFTAAA